MCGRGHETTEDRGLGGFFVEMERLRIPAAADLDDLLFRELVDALERRGLTDDVVLVVLEGLHAFRARRRIPRRRAASYQTRSDVARSDSTAKRTVTLESSWSVELPTPTRLIRFADPASFQGPVQPPIEMARA